MTGTLAAFLGISILVIVTPGPDTALTIRNSLLGGRAVGVWTAAGVSAGQLFFASVLPQFAPHGQGMLSALVGLGVTFSALTFLWLGVYAAVISAVGARLRRPRVRRVVDAVSGAVLVALGVRLASER